MRKATSWIGSSKILSNLSAHALGRWGSFITLNLDDSTYELISRTASIKGVSVEESLRLLLRKGMHIHDSPEEIRRQIDALQEQREALGRRREELFKRFSGLSGEYSTLRYRYYEAFIENRILAMHLCGRGLAGNYGDLVDRYIFTKPAADA